MGSHPEKEEEEAEEEEEEERCSWAGVEGCNMARKSIGEKDELIAS
jgi:hypothetical protein